MEQNVTAQSFIVRLYRVDTEDTRKITGLVEALDSSGRQAPFRDVGELAGLLNNSGLLHPGKEWGKQREGADPRNRREGQKS